MASVLLISGDAQGVTAALPEVECHFFVPGLPNQLNPIRRAASDRLAIGAKAMVSSVV